MEDPGLKMKGDEKDKTNLKAFHICFSAWMEVSCEIKDKKRDGRKCGATMEARGCLRERV